MKSIKRSNSKISFPLFIGTGLLLTFTSFLNNTYVLAQSIPVRWENQQYQPPAGTGSINGGGQGGTRGPDGSITQIVPLIPTSNNFGVTTSAYPTFLVYIPPISSDNSIKYLQFLIWNNNDENGEDFYRVMLPVDMSDRIISISLPDEAGVQPLEINQDYRWSIEGITDLYDNSANFSTQGWIRRIETPTSLSSQLATASPQKQAELYAQAEIWYDAVATLATVYIDNPDNIQVKSDWQQLLKSAGLSDITQEPLASSF